MKACCRWGQRGRAFWALGLLCPDVEDAFDRLIGPQSGRSLQILLLAKTDIIHAGFFKDRLSRECQVQSTQNCGDSLCLANRVGDFFGAQPLSGSRDIAKISGL